MPEAEKRTGDIGLLVVHGIGAQEPRETLRKLLKGLRRVDQDSVPKEICDGAAATVGGQRVRCYEVYWADVLKGCVAEGAFQMKELQSFAWFPWFNLRRGNYSPGSYSSLRLAGWCVALPIINFLAWFSYHGAGLLETIFDPLIKSLWPGAEGAGRSAAFTRVHRTLDEYPGDVFTYVNSAGNAFYWEKGAPPCASKRERAYADIVQRFYAQLVKAHADGCTTIQIVAHSLGAVVTYHALSGFRFDPNHRAKAEIQQAVAKVSRIYTIGCPLEKIRFFWPRLIPSGACFGTMKVQWDNFASWFDPLAGMLRNFDQWGKVSNRRLLGGGFILAHVVYERSPVFLGALSRGLCGHDIPVERGLGERLRNWLLLLGETLLAPALLAVVVILGVFVLAAVAMLIPFGVSLVLRWFLPPETWGPIEDAMSLGMIGAICLAAFAAPLLRAKKVHSRYWGPTASGGDAAQGA